MPSFKPPEPFVPSQSPAETWRKWRQQFELYYAADDVGAKPVAQQRAILLVSLGESALDIYNTLTFDQEEEERTVQIILNAFSTYFQPYRNITYRRHIFFSTVQADGQPVDQYVTELKMKAQDCDFGPLADSLVRDILICGLRDASLRERLLREPNLTLPMAVDMCRADETSRRQNSAINVAGSSNVHAFLRTKPGKSNITPGKQNKSFNDLQSTQNVSFTAHAKKPSSSGFTNRPCSRCLCHHEPRACPAFGKQCAKCGIYNHYAAACRQKLYSKPVHEVTNHTEESEELDESDYFVGSLVQQTIQDSLLEWKEVIVVNSTPVTFKLDTGSHVNIIPADIYATIHDAPALQPTRKKITTYSGHKLTLLGECLLTCTSRNTVKTCNFQIVDTSSPPILGLQSASDFSLVSRVSELTKLKTAETIVEEYTDVFTGLGKLPGQYHISLKEGAIPKIHPARRIPFALEDKVHTELASMEKLGVIARVQEPTDWVHPMVIVNKPNGDVRLCLDPRDLNEAIKREHIKIPTQEEIFAKIQGAKRFTVLDASQAFWQVELDKASSLLCTFATPWGRYRFLRLPYGVSSAPEVFQAKANLVIQGLEDTLSYFDDLLVWGDDQTHDTHLENVLQRCREHNLRLGKKKLQLAQEEVVFMGQTLTSEGMKIQPSRVDAIRNLPTPTCKQDLQRILGMINWLSKYIPNHSAETEYLRKLLLQKSEWVWDSVAQAELDRLKNAIITAPALAYFDSEKPILLSVDASKHGLGAVLLQNGVPVAFASVSLTPAQLNYAQIEKELLAVVFACESFHYYIFAREITVETDHKPLLALHQKQLPDLSPRLQRLMLRLMRYQITLTYVPGRYLYIADTLSRAPLGNSINTDYLEGEAGSVHMLVNVSSEKKKALEEATLSDPILQTVAKYTHQGWPTHFASVPPSVKPFWPHREDIHVQDSCVFRGNRLVIPSKMQNDILKKLHSVHQGIVACKSKAREFLYWPGMSKQIEELILRCQTCKENSTANPHEPLKPHEIPSRPWEKVGVDFMHLKGAVYLVLVDYYSKFVELKLMNNITAIAVINTLKSIFARHGIPCILMTDNGPPFTSESMANFTKEWNIIHQTSSPGYPRSNGMVERTIQTLKNLMQKAFQDKQDLYTVLLEYRTTPVGQLPSPAEMLMGRRLRTALPVADNLLKPQFNLADVNKNLVDRQQRMTRYANLHTKSLKPLVPGQEVVYKQSTRNWKPATVVASHDSPRSYIVQTPARVNYRRNRVDVRPVLESIPSDTFEPEHSPALGRDSVSQQSPSGIQVPVSQEDSQPQSVPTNSQDSSIVPGHRVSRFGRIIHTPLRYKN